MVHPTRPSAETIERDDARPTPAEPIEVMVDDRPRPGYTIGAGPLVILPMAGAAVLRWPTSPPRRPALFLCSRHRCPWARQRHPVHLDGFQIAAGCAPSPKRFGRPEAVVAHSLGAMASVMAFHDAPPRSAVFLAPASTSTRRWPGSPSSPGSPLGPLLRPAQGAGFVGDRWPELTAGAKPTYPAPRSSAHDPADPEVPVAASSELARRRPATHLVETPETGHCRLLRQPEAIGGGTFPRRDRPRPCRKPADRRDWLSRSVAIAGRRSVRPEAARTQARSSLRSSGLPATVRAVSRSSRIPAASATPSGWRWSPG